MQIKAEKKSPEKIGENVEYKTDGKNLESQSYATTASSSSQQQQPASLPTEQHHPFIPTIIIHIVNMDK